MVSDIASTFRKFLCSSNTILLNWRLGKNFQIDLFNFFRSFAAPSMKRSLKLERCGHTQFCIHEFVSDDVESFKIIFSFISEILLNSLLRNLSFLGLCVDDFPDVH